MSSSVSLLAAVAVVICVGFQANLAAADGHSAQDFHCPMCVQFVKRMTASTKDRPSPHEACIDARFGKDACDVVLPYYQKPAGRQAVDRFVAERRHRQNTAAVATTYQEARNVCRQMQLCPAQPVPMKAPDSATIGSWDLRVAPVMMSRQNYSAVRLTVIDNTPVQHGSDFLAAFEYNAGFQNSWTTKTVHTGLFSVTPGTFHNIELGTELTVPVRFPAQGDGIRAIIFGDPCFSSEYVHCQLGATYSVLQNIPHLLNLLANATTAAESTLDLWGIVGDNFYDAGGTLGPLWMSQLGLAAKAVPFVTLLGNHDYWQQGSPTATGTDDWGNGFMQYYGQDTVASVAGGPSAPFDFSHNPSTGSSKLDKQIAVGNTISYTMVGNVAFITFSGANTLAEAESHFVSACTWIGTNAPSWVFVLGHWSAVDMGAEPKMSTSDAHTHISTLSGCAAMSNRIKYVEGHRHCNVILTPGVGYLLGGMGMETYSCKNTFGIPFIDSNNDKMELLYFPLAKSESATKAEVDAAWQTLFQCVQTNGGLHRCKNLAEVWLTQSVTGSGSGSAPASASTSSSSGSA